MRLPPAYRHLGRQLGRFSADDPYERCGYILFRGPWEKQWISLVEVENLADDPTSNAKMRFQPHRPGHRNFVAGTFHTHPGRDRYGGYPSDRDILTAAREPSLLGAVYHPYTRRLAIYDWRGIRGWFYVRPTKIARS